MAAAGTRLRNPGLCHLFSIAPRVVPPSECAVEITDVVFRWRIRRLVAVVPPRRRCRILTSGCGDQIYDGPLSRLLDKLCSELKIKGLESGRHFAALGDFAESEAPWCTE